MKSAVGFFASNTGRSCVIACSAQYSGDPFAVTRRSKRSGGANIRLVSSKAPAWMRSTQITKALPPLMKASRVAGVGQMKSAIAKQPTFTTWSHSHPMRRACSMRSGSENPRSRLMLARTSSALKCTALRRGASYEPDVPITGIRLVWAPPSRLAVLALRRQIQVMLEEPEQSLSCAAELQDFVEDQADGLLHAAVRVLLVAIARLDEAHRRADDEFAAAGLLVTGGERTLPQ